MCWLILGSSLCSRVSFLWLFCVSQLGPNIRQLFRLVEDFVDVIGLRMKTFQDMYEVTDNLGETGGTFSCVEVEQRSNVLRLLLQPSSTFQP